MHLNAHKDKYFTPKSSLQSYLIGIIFSSILTIVPFWIVMSQSLTRNITIAIIIICSALQVIIHLIYFLHLDLQTENGWNVITMCFALIIILIIVVGSLWIMEHLNNNMMLH